MDQEAALLTGGCICGAVKFETNQQPLWISHCHCTYCRKMSGSPFSTGLMYRSEAVRWSGEMRSYESSPGIFRVCCPNCGCYLAFREGAAPEKDCVMLGVLDDPSKIEVDGNVNHIFAKHELRWLHMEDGFPRADELPGSLFKIE